MEHSRNYDICLHTGIGKRYGSMTVETDGKYISGILELLHHKEPFCGTVDENGIMTISGTSQQSSNRIHSPLSEPLQRSLLR